MVQDGVIEMGVPVWVARMPLVCQLPRIFPPMTLRKEALAMAERQFIDPVANQAAG